MLLKDKKIGVLMGGFSSEREISLRSGNNVIRILRDGGYDVTGIDVREDFLKILESEKIQIAFNVLHGFFGEDGRVQAILDFQGIPYTGSGVAASSIAINKILSKQYAALYGVHTAPFKLISTLDDFGSISFDLPWIVKPVSDGSSFGITLIKDKKDIKKLNINDKQYFVEPYLKGVEVTAGILDDGNESLLLPVLELMPKNEFYDFEAKYTAGMTDFILPARLPEPLYEKIQQQALTAHRALGCMGASRSDFIICGEETYFLEINTNPGMTATSDIPAQAKAYGMSELELCERILMSALRGRKG